MNKEDYNKFYIQGSDHYLIPKDVFDELFDEMENWKEENQKLKAELQLYKGVLKKEHEAIHRVNDLEKVIDEAIEYINDNLIISSILDGKKYYTINNYSFDYGELLDILKEVE